MTFDPFGDYETAGYLRNFEKVKDLDIVRRLSFVEHRVAVRADRHQVIDRVQPVALRKRGERSFVVNVDEAFADLAVSLLKINIAHGAPCPVMANAGEAGSPVGGLFGQVATGLAHQRGPLSL